MSGAAFVFDRSEGVPFLCACGVKYEARRWVWFDASGEIAARVRERGPVEGRCPACGAEASGRGPWVELDRAASRASLVLDGDQRAEVVSALRTHLDRVERAELVPGWALVPAPEFRGRVGSLGAPARSPASQSVATAKSAPPIRAPSEVPVPPTRDLEPAAAAPDASLTTSAVPRAVGAVGPTDASDTGEAAEVLVGDLFVGEDTVALRVAVDPPTARLWGTAALRVRPIMVRAHGYPLVGVRLQASYLGRLSILDGVVDPGSEQASSIMSMLARDFRLQLALDVDGATPVGRDVSADGLERNAALCLESARSALRNGDFPPDAFETARLRLEESSLDSRLVRPRHLLAAGDYRFIVTPREAAAALEQLEKASAKENLDQLLELDGLSVAEYEGIRKRVLQSATEFGLPAPRRFWRRVIASGLAEDPQDYVARLVEGRANAAASGEDVPEARAKLAWEGILEVCQRKQVEPPPALLTALGLQQRPEARPRRRRRAETSESMAVAGEIGASTRPDLRTRLAAPETRIDAALEAVELGRDLPDVIAALDRFTPDELVAVLPALAELPGELSPSLGDKLMSPRRELRQAAAILLGILGDPSAIEPLEAALFRERTAAWHDVARALGAYGRRILPSLSQLADEVALDAVKLERVARSMAEVALADQLEPVRALSGASGSPAARAAARALATLESVRADGARVLGDEPLTDGSPAHAFSRRIHEAVSAPEIEVLELSDDPREETRVIDLNDLEML